MEAFCITAVLSLAAVIIVSDIVLTFFSFSAKKKADEERLRIFEEYLKEIEENLAEKAKGEIDNEQKMD